MALEFELSHELPATPEILYSAWLSSVGHSNMTGGAATVSNVVGGTFEAWDGYIQGKNLELEPSKRILQSWRTTEFSDSAEDSLLEILFEAQGTGTLLTIVHSNLPEHGAQYEQGWIDSYIIPMLGYFETT